MKRIAVPLVFYLLLLAVPFSLSAYDGSANSNVVLPECIWAAASGGGTWETEVQIYSRTDTATIYGTFFYGGGLQRGPFTLSTLPIANTYRSTNILRTLDALDSGTFTYYGKVGAVYFYTLGATPPTIQVTAKTINGNYGKTFPGQSVIAANTAAVSRYMRIPCLVNNATYRTFAGFFNTSAMDTYTVDFAIINSTGGQVGSWFSKTFVPTDYMAFNPFVEAGVSAGTYDNCWLFVVPIGGGTSAWGILGFGAIANNITQDPSALIAVPFY